MLINPNKFMKSEDFNQLSNDLKKKRVKNFLNKLTRKDFKSDKEFEAKERIVVNRKDNYGFDNAVFDDQVKIPRHLREPINGD